MRSGFLNTSPSDYSASSFDKGSRNKRKFRTDQQQLPAASPLPSHLCAQNGEAGNNGACVGEACINASMDPQSMHGPDAAAAPPTSMGSYCDGAQNFIPLDMVSYSSDHHPSLVSSAAISPYNPQALDFHTGFQHFPYPTESHAYADLQQDSYWDAISEAQLEEILMSTLDGIYKDAIKRIASFNFTQDEALGAVLRKGRWNKRDTLTSIVESALAWLQSSEARSNAADMAFSSLKEMESDVLTDMVCMLRKVRPYLSKGDAIWCLLICDLNVLLACTLEEGSLPFSLKEESAPSVMASPSREPTNVQLLNALPSNTTTFVPSPQQTPTPCLPQAASQPSNPVGSSHKESRSAFSTPSFSSSPVGKVAVPCRKGASSKSSISAMAQTPANSTVLDSVSLNQQVTHQTVHFPNSHQLSSAPQFPLSEEHATKLGLYISHPNNGRNYLGKGHNWKPDHFVARVSSSDVSPSHSQGTQPAIQRLQCMPQGTDVSAKICGAEPSTSFQPGLAGNKLKGNKSQDFGLTLPNDSKHQVHTDLQIGSTNIFPGFQVPWNESWMRSNACANVNTFASPGAEISLASSSIVSSRSTEFSSESQLDTCMDESFVDCTKFGVPGGHMLGGCIDSNAEERKTVMLWQLVERVKYLEAQLQDWTDWAQQKVMQATRRLTKDTAELKALRQERDEYMRLKKEKQALEESTKKKLAEMESSLGKALNQVDRASSTACRLEAENAQVRAEMEAAKLTAAESVYVCQEATKREKKSSKKGLGWEKQKLKLQGELVEEKRTLSNLLKQLSQGRELLQQAEVKWRQERTAKEGAQVLAEAEKRATLAAEHSIKKREEALQKKAEAVSQRYRDEVQKLESEIAKLRLSSSGGVLPSMLSWANGYKISAGNLEACSSGEQLKQMNGRLLSEISDLRQSQKDVNCDRECVMCSSDEMSVVFLPCAHQVVCVKCNDLHQRKGNQDCPSCRTPIQQRIRVYGVRP